jgi:hypothetical protein
MLAVAVPAPIAGRGPSRTCPRERWPSRLVATAAEERLNFRPISEGRT